MRRTLRLAPFAAAAAFAASLASPTLADGFEKGQPLPELSIDDWYNHAFPTTLEAFRGRPILIEFWRTW